jgi:hypothetical protein
VTSPAPGWYPDPGDVAPFRWWNGQAWTTSTTDGTTSTATQSESLFEHNQYSMYTFVAAALSIFFALATGFVPLIVTPFFTAFASKSKNEKLAPLAFAAAIICGVVGLVTLRHRF